MQRLLARMRDRRGVSALEFAVILPLLVIVFAGVFDLGNALQQSIRLEGAARAAAQYAFSNPNDEAGIRKIIYDNLKNIPEEQIHITLDPTCFCPDEACANCAQRELSITVSRNFEFFSPVSEVITPNLTRVSGNAVVRLY